MEMGLRGWMIVIGILLVLAVLLDGYRRMRNDRRGAIRMSLKMGGGFGKESADDVDLTGELPNGGARVIVRNGAELSSPPEEADDLPSMTANTEDFDPEPLSMSDSSAQQNPSENDKEIAAKSYDEIIVLNVMSKDTDGFNGEDLLHILLACDLRLGEMNILHRYERENAEGPVQFSIANILEPGIFDLNNIKSFATPGITFFFGLPGPEDPIKAFEYMVETAQCVVKNLNGELKDEAHSVVNNQTLEHCKQRIKEYERRQLMQHA